MGLFDKLQNAVEVAKSKVKGIVKHPLDEEPAKMYYEIVYGLLATIEKVSAEGIKKYVEHYAGGECDAEQLQKVLTYFVSRPDNTYTLYDSEGTVQFCLGTIKKMPQREIDRVKEINKTLAESSAYRCSREEALDICYNYKEVAKQALENVKSEYDKVLTVVEANGVEFYREGIDRIVEGVTEKYKGIIDEETVKQFIQVITKDKFLEGNATVKDILFAHLEYYLSSLRSKYTMEVLVFSPIASAALRAVHFEKYGQNKEGYLSFNIDECRSFVLMDNNFKDEVDRHPYDTEKVIQGNIEEIKSANVFNEGQFHYYWMPSENDAYYADMVCNHYWKKLAQLNNMDASQNVNDIYHFLCDCLEALA